MFFVVSVTDLTTQAGWMVALAIVALIAAGWRKTARATAKTPAKAPIARRNWSPIPIAETTVSLYKPPNLIRRIFALIAGSGLAVIIGAILAIIVAFGTGYAVVTLTDLLKQ